MNKLLTLLGCMATLTLSATETQKEEFNEESKRLTKESKESIICQTTKEESDENQKDSIFCQLDDKDEADEKPQEEQTDSLFCQTIKEESDRKFI